VTFDYRKPDLPLRLVLYFIKLFLSSPLGIPLLRLAERHTNHGEDDWYEVTYLQLHLARLNAEFEGYRIVQISDFHIGTWATADILAQAILEVNRQKPDLVAITGDFVTHDPEFEAWANLVFSKSSGSMSLKNFRKDIVIELLNEAGVPVIAYKVYRCWVSEYVALPELDAGENAVAIQNITIEHEGWERDTGVVEPKET